MTSFYKTTKKIAIFFENQIGAKMSKKLKKNIKNRQKFKKKQFWEEDIFELKN